MMMQSTPKSMRLQIALMGRTNTGKSSFLNMISGQDIAVTSPIAGTTTDIVEKSIELLPIGPVTFLDTGGIDDQSILAEKRIQKTMNIFDRADIVVLVCESGTWTEYEDKLIKTANERKIPVITVFNKTDIEKPSNQFMELAGTKNSYFMYCSSVETTERDLYLNKFKELILKIIPSEITNSVPLVGDLVPAGGLAVLIIPIDLQAPKGRLILPQVQTIRDLLDNDTVTLVVKEREYAQSLTMLNKKPDLVVCDSQVVLKMVADTPEDIKCTTFSILFSRFKGDLIEEVRGAAAIENIQPGDKILIAEACSHHPLEDDIGRVKIPRWLCQYLGTEINIIHSAGRDFPDNLEQFKVIIHCGACMITRTEKLTRIEKAKQAGVPITNYGITISLVQGVLKRVLSPFPAALETYCSNNRKS